MPATDFGLMLNEQQPIFHVYSTKRKCPSAPSDLSELVEKSAKRRCLNSEGMETDSVTMETQSFPVPDHCLLRCSPQRLPVDHSQHINHSQPLCSPQPNPDITHLAHTTELENNNHLPSLQPPVFHQQSQLIVPHKSSQSDMIMDLPEEEYSIPTSPTDGSREGASNMEAEGAPDPQQYGVAFCDEFCVGGKVSPTSQRVRCFCKPSWEGLMSSRPYISDYY